MNGHKKCKPLGLFKKLNTTATLKATREYTHVEAPRPEMVQATGVRIERLGYVWKNVSYIDRATGERRYGKVFTRDCRVTVSTATRRNRA